MATTTWGSWLLAPLVFAAAVGCSNGDAEEAEESLARWRERGPDSYVYMIERSCFCQRHGVVRVVVEGDLVVSAVATKTGEMLSDQVTMTELLQEVVRMSNADKDEFAASYDTELGYLKAASGDDHDTSDSGFSYIVSCFGAGSGDDVCPFE